MTEKVAAVFQAHCPHCRSIEFRKVGWRNSLERAIRFIFLPYRCELCGHHFFLLRWQYAHADI